MKILRLNILILMFILLGGQFVYAHCPLCTGAVGAAAASAKLFGLDTTIVGLYVGAFGISTGLMFGRKIKRKIPFQTFIFAFSSLLLTIIPVSAISNEELALPLLFGGDPGSVFNKVYWMNKMIFGGLLGGIGTLFAFGLHEIIKKKNGGKVLFPFQGIVLTLGVLFLLSIFCYFAFPSAQNLEM